MVLFYFSPPTLFSKTFSKFFSPKITIFEANVWNKCFKSLLQISYFFGRKNFEIKPTCHKHDKKRKRSFFNCLFKLLYYFCKFIHSYSMFLWLAYRGEKSRKVVQENNSTFLPPKKWEKKEWRIFQSFFYHFSGGRKLE